MIQFRRGKSASWRAQTTPLADGQPGYDKDRHKLKIGDGKSSWDELPDASGMFADEILDSEENAKVKAKAKAALNPLGTLVSKLLKKDDRPIITYGTKSPDKDTVGQVYLQYYDAEPEVDYVVESGVSNGWSYKKWKSGQASCSIVFDVFTSVQTAIGSSGLYQNSSAIKSVQYPFTFITDKNTPRPSETATVQSPSGLVWLASAKGINTNKQSATYSIISADKLSNSATYRISIKVEGFWR